MKSSTGFKPALTPTSYQDFQAKSFFANEKFKTQKLEFCYFKTLFWVFENK